MLTTLEAYSAWKSAPLLPLSAFGVEADPIQIRDITGLGPVEASINTTPYGSFDGGLFTGSLVGSRNIVMTVGLNPDWDNWTVESLRRLFYSYFMSKQPVRLIFHSDDMPSVGINGYVETTEPVHFSKDGEIKVSIICPDPYFTAIEPKVLTGFAVDVYDPISIDYKGSVEAGIHLTLSEGSPPDPTLISIQLGDPVETYFRVAATVTANKYFVANTVPGEKYVQNVALGTGIITNLLSKIAEGSKWPTLQPGLNDFAVIADGGTQDWELSYFERFGGI